MRLMPSHADRKFCNRKCANDFIRGLSYEERYGEEVAQRMREVRRKKRNSPSTEFKKGWQFTEEGRKIIAKRLKSLITKPNRPERKMIKLISKYNLPFRYVGDGSLIIGSKNPDFVYLDDGRKIIEVFGDYWHRNDVAKHWHQTEDGAKQYYASFGYNILIIWEHELQGDDANILEKINKFIKTTLEIDVDEDFRELFVSFANESFNNDTGACLKWLWDQAWEYQAMKEKLIDLGSIDARLRILEDNLLAHDNKTEKSIKLLNGKIIRRRDEK